MYNNAINSSQALEIKIQEKEAYIIIYLLDPTCIQWKLLIPFKDRNLPENFN
jgi:hypothetical protein